LRLQKKSSRLASHLDLKAGFFAGFSQGLEKSCRSRAPAYSTLSFRGMETTISDSEQPGNDKLDSAEKPHMGQKLTLKNTTNRLPPFNKNRL